MSVTFACENAEKGKTGARILGALSHFRSENPVAMAAPDVERGILAFARKAGICFGSIDFAVDTDGNWWFLEINEQGQFLWLDQFNPEVKMQEKFCAFITAPGGSTQLLEEREGLFPSFAEYVKICEEQQAKQEAPDLGAIAASSPYVSRKP